MLNLETELRNIKGINEKFLLKLDKLKLKTVRDLLWHFPFRYDDFSTIVNIGDLKTNQAATIRGVVQKVSLRRSWRRKFVIIEAIIADETGGIKAVWFNQPYIAKALRAGLKVNFAGKVVLSNDELVMQSPAYEPIGLTTEAKHTAGLIPIYSETKGLTSKGLRFLISAILKVMDPAKDFIPEDVLIANEMPNLMGALRGIHFPTNLGQAERARQRFAFSELLLLQLANLRSKIALTKEKAPPLLIERPWIDEIVGKLPFPLTDAQTRSLDEILTDLGKSQPMNRLLQGDVGSGKTVVAAIAALAAAKNEKQTAFMAPTEVLARQHYKTLTTIFKNLTIGVGILTGSEARVYYGDDSEMKTTRAKLLADVESGKLKLILGTHALISEGKIKKPIRFNDLALAIVDEQHRFGVEQRAALVKLEKKPGDETTIHFLSMSATPIPRTLALTIFGDLDISIIDELPKGRKEIVTKVVSPENRQKAYDFIRAQVKSGRQVFVICPRIEAAIADDAADGELLEEAPTPDKRKDLWQEVKNVTEVYEALSKRTFPDLRLAMLHGKLKSAEKAKIMYDLSAGNLDILVSTSVIEVGVDVPNASIMMVEGADRFGLSQLYQFRGRVGRGEHQSYCLLFSDSTSESTQNRLNALLKAKNGFELAEEDLAIRGPGQFIGDKQTGIPDIAMKALNNMELVKAARESASSLLKKDGELSGHPVLRLALARFQKQIHLE